MPGRVTRLTLSWPNADGLTMGSRTTWVLEAPAWLPIPYPRVSGAITTQTLPGGQYPVASQSRWTWQGRRYAVDLSYTVRIPPQAGFVGCVSVASASPADPPLLDIPIQPAHLDEVVEILTSGQPNVRFSNMRAPATAP